MNTNSGAASHVPAEYLRFHAAGLTSDDPARGVVLSDFRWLAPQEIGEWEFYIPRAHRFVPFAATPGHDAYCWWLESDAGPAAAIVFSPNDSDRAEVVCETFGQFLAWALLREGLSTDLPDQLDMDAKDVAPLLADYVARLESFLAPGAARTLRGLFANPTKDAVEEGALITEAQYDEAVKQLVPFVRRGETFTQYADE